METQGFCHLSSMLSWIFAFLIAFVCSGIGAQSFRLENKVFVAFAGEDLCIDFQLVKPANHSGGTLKCFDPKNRTIHSSAVSETADRPEAVRESVTLKKLESDNSGDYRCEYQIARAFWVLLVRDEGYSEPYHMSDYTGVIIAGISAFVLLVFSVVGSVYISKVHRDVKPLNTEHGSIGGRSEQNREESREEEEEEDHNNATTAPSTSFYASLETRPRSIYDVLDQSAANREAGQRKAKPKSKENKKTTEQTPPNQDEGVFESVYENL